MALDPSIPLGGQPLKVQSPFEALSAATQLAGLREQNEARRLAGEERRQKAADEAAIRRVFQESGGDVDAAITRLRTVAPTASIAFEKSVAESRKAALEQLKERTTLQSAQLDLGIKVAQSITDEPSHQAARRMIGALDPAVGEMFGETYDPANIDRLINMGLSAKDRADQRRQALDLFAKGDATRGLAQYIASVSPEEGAPMVDSILKNAKDLGTPAAITDLFRGDYPTAIARAKQLAIGAEKRAELEGQAAGRAQTAAHQGVLEQQGAERIAIARQRALRPSGSAQTDREDVEAIADAIIKGDQPPSLTGLYRYGAPVRAALAKKGYELADAQTDWAATQRHFATLNGPQQTRLRQAVETATHSLDTIEALAKRWKGTGVPILNRANLRLAKGGAYGSEIASVAQQLEAQIADVTSELANAYMGGNSPTDHAMDLAAKNLSADWSEQVLKDMIALARTNLTIRSNAIKNTGVIGASATNAYGGAPPPADRVRVIGPNGETGTVPRGTTLPSGWRLQ